MDKDILVILARMASLVEMNNAVWERGDESEIEVWFSEGVPDGDVDNAVLSNLQSIAEDEELWRDVNILYADILKGEYASEDDNLW